MRKLGIHGLGAAMALALVGASNAATLTLPTYGAVGTQNAATYSFTATTTGHIVAYYTGSTGSDAEWLGLETGPDNQHLTLSPVQGLENHQPGGANPLTLGTSLDFGLVQAGQTLVFYIQDLNDGRSAQRFYSDASLNPDSQSQHIYSTSFNVAAGDTIGSGPSAFVVPAGAYTYVGFEDLPATDHFVDWNYHDETFIFTDVSVNAPLLTPPPSNETAGVPEPAGWALMITGFGGLGVALRRRRTGLATA